MEPDRFQNGIWQKSPVEDETLSLELKTKKPDHWLEFQSSIKTRSSREWDLIPLGSFAYFGRNSHRTLLEDPLVLPLTCFKASNVSGKEERIGRPGEMMDRISNRATL